MVKLKLWMMFISGSSVGKSHSSWTLNTKCLLGRPWIGHFGTYCPDVFPCHAKGRLLKLCKSPKALESFNPHSARCMMSGQCGSYSRLSAVWERMQITAQSLSFLLHARCLLSTSAPQREPLADWQMFLRAEPAYMNHNNSSSNDFDAISSQARGEICLALPHQIRINTRWPGRRKVITNTLADRTPINIPHIHESQCLAAQVTALGTCMAWVCKTGLNL